MKYFIIAFLFLTSCSVYKSGVIDNSKPLYFDKVKLQITDSDKMYSLNGFMNVNSDSSVCSKFYMLGFETFAFQYSDKLYVRNFIDNVSYVDTNNFFQNKIGYTISKKSFHSFCSLDYENFVQQFLKDNLMLQLSNKKIGFFETTYHFIHKNNNSEISVLFKNKKSLPLYANFKIVSFSKNVSIQVEFLSVSLQKKKCNFEF